MCQQRFGRPFSVAVEDYQRFIDTMVRLFETFGLNVSHETMYNNPSAQRTAPVVEQSSTGLYVLLVLAAAVVALLVVAVLMILR